MGLSTQTFGDLIKLALKNAGVVGVGQTPQAEDMNDACAMMNNMIAQWQQRRYLVYHLIEQTVPCNGNQTYSIGPGGDISVPLRPAAINAAYARQTINANPNQIDYPLAILPSRETYSLIAMKGLQSFPQWCWYDAAMPLGQLFVYPVITSQFELHVVFREQLQQAVSLTDTINLPPEYQEAIIYNLAVRIAGMYQVPIHPSIVPLAKAALETMRSINAQIPTMGMPAIMRSGAHWNVFSDRSGPNY